MAGVNTFGSKFNLISILVLILFLLSSVYSAAPVLTDAELLDSTQAKAANYFYEQATSSGFVKDIQTTPYSSTAATGFGLATFTIMSERYGTNSNWIYTPTQLRARTNQILDNIILIQSKQVQDPISYGTHGMLYHFINSDNTNSASEVSTIDSALLFAGVITAGEYFGGEVKEKANKIMSNVDWAFFQKTPENNFTTKEGNTNMYQFTMAWSPSNGYAVQCWDMPTDEAMLISVLALATNPTNVNFQKSLFSWPRVTRTYAGYPVVNSYFGTLFSYEFAHFFIDFEKIGFDTPAGINDSAPAVDWWQNSINAAKANRQFCINNASTYSSYGPDSWGLSSVYRPNGNYYGELGALPTFSMAVSQDGTVAPYSSISTMPFFKNEDSGILANNLGFRVLRNLYNTRYDTLWGIYGPKDSFNDKNAVSSNYLGLDQGPIVISIENYKTGLVMNQFMKNTSIKAALKKVFTCPNGVCDTTIVCSLDSQCNDNNSLTTDVCQNAGTTQSSCIYTPFVACSSNLQCSDNNISTDDLCVNPGVPSSYCSFVPNGKTCVVPTNGMQLTESTTFCYNGYDTHDINIAADNITVDCAGALFTTPIGSYFRFRIEGRKNVTLKNCVVGKSSYGIYISKSSSITLSDNTFRGSYDTAIYAIDSNKLNIINNNILDNEYQNGIYFYNITDSNITNNTMSNNGFLGGWGHKGAISFNYSNGNRVVNNNLSDNYRALHIVYYSSNNYFENNRLCGNTIENTCGGGTIGNTGSGNIIPTGYGTSCSWLTTNSRSCESTCDDSIDGGLNYFVKGTTTFWNGLTAGAAIDSCVDNFTLKEYSCSPGFLETTNNCTYGCKDGACLNNYVCSVNTDCPSDNYNLVFDSNLPGRCIQYTGSDVTRMSDKLVFEYDLPLCTNAGTIEASCSELSVLLQYVVKECPYGCVDGNICLPAPVCSSDSDCGIDTNRAQYCDKNNLVQANNTLTCANPGTQTSVCVKNTASTLVEACANGCSNAKCNVACSNNNDCGQASIITQFCKDNYLYDSITSYTCNNPGASSSYCSSTDMNSYNQTCAYGCLLGACVNAPIQCTNDLGCNDNNSLTIDACTNPGTTQSVCTHTPIVSDCVTPVDGMQLTKSVTFCNGNYNYISDINFVNDNIVLTCDNTKLDMGFDGGTIFTIAGRNNITIQGCTVSGGNYTVFVQKSKNIKLIDNNFNKTWDTGVYVSDSNKLLIARNTIKNNAYQNAIYFKNVFDSNIETNLMTGNGNSGTWGHAGGIALLNSSGNKITNNTVNKSNRSIYMSASSSNVFTNNSFCLNEYSEVCSGTGNIASGNKLTSAAATSCAWLANQSTRCDQNCSDSDGGHNYLIKGTITFWDGNSTVNNADYCDGNNLIEYFCSNESLSAEYNYCSLGCSLGACVKAACSSNIDCNDNNPRTIDTCANPGTTNSTCSNVSVVCFNNTECNDNNSQTVDTCVNAATAQSYCTNVKPLIACSTAAQCGVNGYLSTPSCSGSYVKDMYRTYSCVSPGTTSSRCSFTDVLKTKQTCLSTQICSNGACVVPTCKTNTQCNDNNVLTIDVCVNPNTINSNCTHTSIACTTSTQCGVNAWLGQNTCNGNNIGDFYRTFSCVSPGTVASYCKSTDVLKTKSYCSYGTLCSSGTCVKPTCSSNTACNDNNSYTADVCVNPGKLTSVCTNTQIRCLTNVDCGDGDPFTQDVCKNPKLVTSYCAYTKIACTDNSSCNDSNPLTLDVCSSPNTISSKCNYTAIKCGSNLDCEDNNSLTSNVCLNPGLTTSVCKYYPPIPAKLWEVNPNPLSLLYFSSATCNVLTKSYCPAEMGWEGNKVTYSFTLPYGDLTEGLDLKFYVINMNYRNTPNVKLKVSAGSSTASLAVVDPAFEIDTLGELSVRIPTSYFKQGATNYIQLFGTNITPIGTGRNPPNFKINSISLNQIQ